MVYNEYTVALNSGTGEKINAWAGHKFRPYNENAVEQFKVQGDISAHEAVERAVRIWRNLKDVRKRLHKDGRP